MHTFEKLGFKGNRTSKGIMSKTELDMCDWNVKEFQAKIQTW